MSITNRYLVAGCFNTLFGYFFSLILYYMLRDNLSVVTIGIIINVFTISMAFLAYKLYVFKTSGNWIKEYFRCYTTYGFSAILSVILMWFLVEKVGMLFWLAQGLIIGLCALISYYLHLRFTFKTYI
jgi:putative flippase GtrA